MCDVSVSYIDLFDEMMLLLYCFVIFLFVLFVYALN